MSGVDNLCITGLGMVTALGRDAISSCAAARAGLSNPRELTTLDFASDAEFGDELKGERAKVHGHPILGSGDGFTGIGKLLVQGGDALADLLRARPLNDREQRRTGLLVNVSDHYLIDEDASRRGGSQSPSLRWKSSTQWLADRLVEEKGLDLPKSHLFVRHLGNAGGAAVVAEAAQRIARGEVDRFIVGGMDARTDPVFLKAAARLFQLRMIDNPAGLSPGEAAAFLMIERESDAMYSNYPALARLLGAWTATGAADIVAEDVAPNGATLSEVLRMALSELTTKTGGVSPWILGDLNGTQRRAVEWANALVRLRATYSIMPSDAWFGAPSFGDVGAASGPVAVACAVRAFVRGYARSSVAIVSLSSESGGKGAIGLQRPGR